MAAGAGAQTFTIPTPDGKTIISANNVWSCVQAAGGLPAGMAFDGTTLTVARVSTAQLTLTGGAVYPDGQYLAAFKSGVLTWTPYVAPVASGGSAPSVWAGFSNTAVTGMAPFSATATYTVAVAAVPGTSIAQVYPLFDPGSPFDWKAVVSGPNVVTVRIWNRTASLASLPAGKWKVEIR